MNFNDQGDHQCWLHIIIIIIIIIIIPCELCESVLASCLWLESEWQQVFLSLQDSSKHSSQS